MAQIEETWASDGTHMGTEITYLHTDQLGAPRLGTDQNKAVTWEYKSDGFGMAQLSGTATVRLRMPGQIDYGLAGIYYNYFRDYDSNTGRYLQSDPIGLDGGANTYGYALQNPARYLDPDGLFGIQEASSKALIATVEFVFPPYGPDCGPGKYALYFPDGPWKNACKKHDACYADCNGPSRWTCDLRFLRESGNVTYFAAIRAAAYVGSLDPFIISRSKCKKSSCDKK